MKIYFNKYGAWLNSKSQLIQAVLLFGSDATTLEYCQEQTLNFLKKTHLKIQLTRYNQTQIIETPEFLQTGASLDLFNTAFSVVIIEDCTDKIFSIIEQTSPFSATQFFILRGLGLRTTAKIVKYFENHMTLGCVGCYTADHDYIRSTIQQKFLATNRTIQQNALELMIQHCDFKESLALTEKLFLYKNSKDPVTLQDIEKFLVQEPAFHMETFVEQILSRATYSLEFINQDSVSENFLPLVRTLVYRFKRILFVLEKIQSGQSLETALQHLTPAVLFFQKESFCQNLKKWNIPEVLERLRTLYVAEITFKKGLSSIVSEKYLLNIL